MLTILPEDHLYMYKPENHNGALSLNFVKSISIVNTYSMSQCELYSNTLKTHNFLILDFMMM